MTNMADNPVRKALTGEPTKNPGHFGSAPARADASLELHPDDVAARIPLSPTTERNARAALTAKKKWSDPGNDDYDWPWPDEHTKHIVDGELAERIRRALGVDDPAASVFVIETESYGGTEATQEHFKSIVLECAGRAKEFDDGMSGPLAFNGMLEWLDAEAPREQP